MAATSTLSINSCLRPSSSLPPPPTTTTMIRTITSTHPWTWTMSKDDVACSWRSRCVSSMAGVVVGATIALVAGGDGEVLAGEVGTAERSLEHATSAKVLRWSDKRTCPPWNANSLESVVPENLPRPLGGRRNNRFAFYKGTAPAIGSSSSSSSSSSVRFNGGGGGSSNCFSL